MYKRLSCVEKKNWEDRFDGLAVLSIANQRRLIESYLKQAETSPAQNQYEENFRVKLVRRLHNHETSQGEITMHATGTVTQHPSRVASPVPTDRKRSGTPEGMGSSSVSEAQGVPVANYDPAIDRAQRAQINPVEVKGVGGVDRSQIGIISRQDAEPLNNAEVLEGRRVLTLWNNTKKEFSETVKAGTILLGPSGSGKSSLSRFLLGGIPRLAYAHQSPDPDDASKSITIFSARPEAGKPSKAVFEIDSEIPNLPKVGHTSVSETLGITRQTLEGVVMFDTGGTNDNRGEIEQLVNALSTFACASLSEAVSFVLCFKLSDIASRSGNFLTTMNFLSDFIVSEKYPGSIALFVSDVKETIIDENCEERRVYSGVDTVLKELTKIDLDFRNKGLFNVANMVTFLSRDEGRFIKAVNFSHDQPNMKALRDDLKSTILGLTHVDMRDDQSMRLPISSDARARLQSKFANMVIPHTRQLKAYLVLRKSLESTTVAADKGEQDIQTLKDIVRDIQSTLVQQADNSENSGRTIEEIKANLATLKSQTETRVLEAEARIAVITDEITEAETEISRVKDSKALVPEPERPIDVPAAEKKEKKEYRFGEGVALGAELVGAFLSTATDLGTGRANSSSYISKDEKDAITNGVTKVTEKVVRFVATEQTKIVTEPGERHVSLRGPMGARVYHVAYSDNCDWREPPLVSPTEGVLEFRGTLVNRSMAPMTAKVTIYVRESESTNGLRTIGDKQSEIIVQSRAKVDAVSAKHVLETQLNGLNKLIADVDNDEKSIQIHQENIETLVGEVAALRQTANELAVARAQQDTDIAANIQPDFQSLVSISTDLRLNLHENPMILDFFQTFEAVSLAQNV